MSAPELPKLRNNDNSGENIPENNASPDAPKKRNYPLIGFIAASVATSAIILGPTVVKANQETPLEKALNSSTIEEEESTSGNDNATTETSSPEVDLDNNKATFTTEAPAPAPTTAPTSETVSVAPQESLDSMTAEKFKKLDPEMQVDYGMEKLISKRADSYNFLFQTKDIPLPSESNDPLQATIDMDKIITADLYTASIESRTNAEEGAKLLAAIINPHELPVWYQQLSDMAIGPDKTWINFKGTVESTNGNSSFDSQAIVTYEKTSKAAGATNELDLVTVTYTAQLERKDRQGNPIYSMIGAQ